MTSASDSSLTRRCTGILTFSTISFAFDSPMPWMYCSAMTTRLLVGILTPAIRATLVSPLDCPRKQPHLHRISPKSARQTQKTVPAPDFWNTGTDRLKSQN
jgi:hypothetical protein